MQTVPDTFVFFVLTFLCFNPAETATVPANGFVIENSAEMIGFTSIPFACGSITCNAYGSFQNGCGRCARGSEHELLFLFLQRPADL
jgi:hypothetical protein